MTTPSKETEGQEENRLDEFETWLAQFLRDNHKGESGFTEPVWTLCRKAFEIFYGNTDAAALDAAKYGLKASDPVPGAVPWHPLARRYTIKYPVSVREAWDDG